ncbi:hypothetical protein B0T22DRAFT_110232 [Podospora appendiculata]|uniref:Uncharacterized protein n=1 Tax=Podospora appendiculata TaxID=314037 RepID=A0AAE0XLD2_9PEZI|nr:hypothetical protein B0T22DRAFT_110232 [Podospora appendiculata]
MYVLARIMDQKDILFFFRARSVFVWLVGLVMIQTSAFCMVCLIRPPVPSPITYPVPCCGIVWFCFICHVSGWGMSFTDGSSLHGLDGCVFFARRAMSLRGKSRRHLADWSVLVMLTWIGRSG